MLGLMQDRPLLISALLEHAARNHRASRIVSARPDGSLVRHGWADIAARAAQLAHALSARGVQQGERIATLAWNDHRHLEAYYGISSMGAVLHTVNPRLFPDQLAYILADAQDTHLFVDPTIWPVVEALADKLPASLRAVIVMGEATQIPAETKLKGKVELLAQEALIAGQPTRFDWPDLDERSASSLCYTSGTTGDPKGVLYSHRSTVIHALASVQKDCFGLGATDSIMPVVPMFHVNAWGIPYAAAAVGASLILPGPKLDPASLFRLFEEEKVDFSAGVPTIWTALLQWLRADPSRRFTTPPRLVVGGTALPHAINAGFLKEYGVTITHAWGMTETSPLGTANVRKVENADWDEDRFLDYARKQGRPLFGVEMENLIMGHPDVAQAAVIAMHHPKWDERPLLLVVAKPGTTPTQESILAYYEGKVAKWWIPDAVEFVESLPMTATGKIWKAALKGRFQAPAAG